jgi:hypothetical protein
MSATQAAIAPSVAHVRRAKRERTTRITYNSFAPENRRREALDAFADFCASAHDAKDYRKHICSDDIAAFIEMMIEERRNKFKITIENAEIV